MSSSERRPTYPRGQAVYAHTQRGWSPLPGIHSGLVCSVCGETPEVVYRLAGSGQDFCPTHQPFKEAD